MAWCCPQGGHLPIPAPFLPKSLGFGEEGRSRAATAALGQQTRATGLGMEPAVSCPEGTVFLWGEDNEVRKWIFFFFSPSFNRVHPCLMKNERGTLLHDNQSVSFQLLFAFLLL